MHGQGHGSGSARKLTNNQLSERLDELLATLADGPDRDEQRDLLLDLQVHQIELEMQSRELREAQRQLELSRDRYARLFDLAPVGYAVFDRHGRILDINLTGARMLGRVRSRVVEAPFPAFLDPGDMGRFLSHVDDILKSPDPSPGPVRLTVRLRATNGVRTLRLLSSACSGEQGPECFSALVDITAQEEAKARERDGGQLRQAVLDALPAQVAVLDGEGRIIAVNAAWRRFAEENRASRALQAGVGLNYLAACAGPSWEGAEEARCMSDGIAAVLAGTSAGFTQEYPCHAPDRKRWFTCTAVPLGGGLQGAVVVHFDISSRVVAEEEARRSRDTAAQAARVNAVGILAASLIHELTQPLSAAGFFGGTALTMVEQGRLERDELKRIVSGIDAQIRRAASILQRLREFLRRREMRMEPVAVESVVTRAATLCHWYASDKKVELRLAEAPAAGLLVRADSLQLEQVVVNLICNAVQAIDEAATERREVSVAIERRPNEVQVTVADTGPGLATDAGDELFDIFTSNKDVGLGMGLAISRDIVEAHGGKLWADPPAGAGAIFHFTLPLKSEDQSG